MNRLLVFAVVALGTLLTANCSPTPVGQRQVQSSLGVHALVGGCAGTIVSELEPPTWAQGGWHGHVKGTPWSVPWAMGSPGNAVAYLFAGELVAGASPRVNGTNNKILWVAKDAEWGFAVDGSPLGAPKPIVSLVGGPTIVDVPTAGCWTFRLSSTSTGKHISTINLQVLPSGS